MARRQEAFRFTGSTGDSLSALLDLPDGDPAAYALFAHCFTCGKDIFAAARIAGDLAQRGIAVRRFDFTGLGHSEGEFANSSFSSNVDDVVRAADALRERHAAPALLVGHSLGGAAILAAADRIPEAVAVATIGAPADPAHVAAHFKETRPDIEARGEAEVLLGGRTFRIRRQFLEDISAQNLEEAIRGLHRALLIFHAPRDETVGIDNAGRIFAAARHPKSFVSLDDADHLLTRRADARYVAEVLAAWAGRYLDTAAKGPSQAPADAQPGAVAVRTAGPTGLAQDITAGRHRLRADEPESAGGEDSGPDPYGFLLAGLGACTAMTLRLYATRKEWPLTGVSVYLQHNKIHASDCADCETRAGRIDEISRRIALDGDLDGEQRRRLLEIADRCPVHRTLTGEIKIRTELVSG